ncbi:hypothetical protein T190130A13A_130008 [Tenacibaculum sp. 190130A14a]
MLSLGKVLNRAEQKAINGSKSLDCRHMERCSSNQDCGPKDCVLICLTGRCRAY